MGNLMNIKTVPENPSSEPDDDDDDDELSLWYGGPIISRSALFPARTTVRDPHHHEFLTCREQGLNLHRT